MSRFPHWPAEGRLERHMLAQRQQARLGSSMATKIGINGFGRIGRQVLKAITDRYGDTLEVVAVNDLVAPEVSANLLKYDSNYGQWKREIRATEDAIFVDGREIKVFAE